MPTAPTVTIATASDAQLQHIGMIAGQSAFTFRDDAKRYLMVAGAAAKEREAEEKLKAANEEFSKKEAEWKERFELMQAQMEQFMAAATEQAKGKPGRKPKTEADEAQEG